MFIVVTVNVALQARTLAPAARRLKVITPAEPVGIDVEAAPLEAMHADLLHAQIPPGSRLHGVEIFEFRLPAQANMALIVRDNRGFIPQPTTTLQAGDRLLIVASATVREQTDNWAATRRQPRRETRRMVRRTRNVNRSPPGPDADPDGLVGDPPCCGGVPDGAQARWWRPSRRIWLGQRDGSSSATPNRQLRDP